MSNYQNRHWRPQFSLRGLISYIIVFVCAIAIVYQNSVIQDLRSTLDGKERLRRSYDNFVVEFVELSRTTLRSAPYIAYYYLIRPLASVDHFFLTFQGTRITPNLPSGATAVLVMAGPLIEKPGDGLDAKQLRKVNMYIWGNNGIRDGFLKHWQTEVNIDWKRLVLIEELAEGTPTHNPSTETIEIGLVKVRTTSSPEGNPYGQQTPPNVGEAGKRAEEQGK